MPATGFALVFLVILSPIRLGNRRKLAEASYSTACDVYHGQWEATREEPRYSGRDACAAKTRHACPRKAEKLSQWRWKPRDCDLPRLDPPRFLDCMRNRHLAVVGDSLSGNMLESLSCIMKQHVDHNAAVFHHAPSNFTISHVRSNFLTMYRFLKQSGKKGKGRGKEIPTLYVNIPEPKWHKRLKEFTDILFIIGPHFAPVSRFSQSGGRLVPASVPLKNSVSAVAKTVATALTDFSGRALMFSHPPAHFVGGAWDKGGKCSGFSAPSLAADPASESFNRQLFEALDSSKVRVMNITHLSAMRPDSHPAEIAQYGGAKLKVQDCVHFCVPGLPDTWSDLVAHELCSPGSPVRLT